MASVFFLKAHGRRSGKAGGPTAERRNLSPTDKCLQSCQMSLKGKEASLESPLCRQGPRGASLELHEEAAPGASLLPQNRSLSLGSSGLLSTPSSLSMILVLTLDGAGFTNCLLAATEMRHADLFIYDIWGSTYPLLTLMSGF